MKLKLTKGRIASQNEIAAFQQKLGEVLPSEFLEFVAQNDGAEPETNIFKIGATNESGVNGFIRSKKSPTRYRELKICRAGRFRSHGRKGVTISSLTRHKVERYSFGITNSLKALPGLQTASARSWSCLSRSM